ncbi:Zmynd15 [Scenedesmus sp. PABB004]|nr:Zmynd15 [Scenedesmus sp. PABB004]
MATGNALACQVCGTGATAAHACPGCGALAYCGEEHLRLARRLGHDAAECRRMAAQLARAAEVHGRDLRWPAQTAADVCAWLHELHAHGQGMLQHCCPAHPWRQQDEGLQQQAPPLPAGLPQREQAWRAAWAPLALAHAPPWPLAGGGSGLAQPLEAPEGWAAYYARRGVAGDSPAALALHFVLTLGHCLARVLPGRGWPLPGAGGTLTVAYLGPQAELQLLPAFAELCALLPGRTLRVHLCGPDVPAELHGKACSTAAAGGGGSLTVSCWAGCWHDVADEWQHSGGAAAAGGAASDGGAAAGSVPAAWTAAAPPDLAQLSLVLAPNAGLPAFPSWLPSLRALLRLAPPPAACETSAETSSVPPVPGAGAGGGGPPAAPWRGVPVLFTDYCEEAAAQSGALAAAVLGRGFDLGPALNPFRQPAPAAGHGTRLPAVSNAFLFGWA